MNKHGSARYGSGAVPHILSLVFWALMVVATIKYVWFVMRAANDCVLAMVTPTRFEDENGTRHGYDIATLPAEQLGGTIEYAVDQKPASDCGKCTRAKNRHLLLRQSQAALSRDPSRHCRSTLAEQPELGSCSR